MVTPTAPNLQKVSHSSLASVIQVSAIAPVSYVVNASDLRSFNPDNELFKFADNIHRLDTKCWLTHLWEWYLTREWLNCD